MFENDRNSRLSNFLKNKPPLPERKEPYGLRSILHEVRNLGINSELDENCENTIDTIHLNESDLNELEDEFTFEAEDEDMNSSWSYPVK